MKKYLLLALISLAGYSSSVAQIICVMCYGQNNPLSTGVTNLVQNGGFEIGGCTNGSFCTSSTYYTCGVPNWVCTGGGSSTYAQVFTAAGAWYGSFLSEVIFGNQAIYMGNFYANPCSPTNNDTSCVSGSGCEVDPFPTGFPYNYNPGYGGASGLSLEQTVSGLVVGNTYVLEFWTGGEYDASSPYWGVFGVDIGFGNTLLRCKPTNNGDIGIRYIIEFKATSTSHTIKFTNWGHICSSCTELVLDDVSLYTIGELSPSVPVCSGNGVLTASVNKTDATCNGLCDGQATVSPSGGTSPYTYTWNTTPVQTTQTASNLCAGTYSVIITDSTGLTVNKTVVITQPPALVLSSSQGQVSCNGFCDGGATIFASGGSPSFTYSWNTTPVQTTPNATSLCAGNYTCTVTDANGCASTKTVSITQPATLTATATATDVACNGQCSGITSVSTSGGTPGYSYSWSGTSSNAATVYNQCAGLHTCTITDSHGCTVTQTVTVNQAAAIVVTSTAVNAVCNGQCTGSASVAASGGMPSYTYSWNSTPVQTGALASGLCAGSYTCTITDSYGCTKTRAVQIMQPTAVQGVFTSTTISCNGQCTGTASVLATGGTPSYSYAWSTSPVQTDSIANGLCAGNYTCTITDNAGCVATVPLSITQPAPLTITTSVVASCNGGSQGIAGATPSGGTAPYTISWSTAPVQTSTTANGLLPGTYTVTVSDAKFCSAAQTVVVGEDPPVDSLFMLASVCATDPEMVVNAPSGGTSPFLIGAPYQWYQSGNNINGATGSSYQVNVANASLYSVSWFYKGCRHFTTALQQAIYQAVFIPRQTNIFTPNEDRINDEFFPFALDNGSSLQVADSLFEEYTLTIYDRWGLLIFETSNVTQLWNGKNNGGKPVPAGTYYWLARYKLKCTTETKNLKGFVELIR